MARKHLFIVIPLVFGSGALAQVGPWGGYYFGVSGTSTGMQVKDISVGAGAFLPSGGSLGGFTGLTHQIDALVLGAEAGFELSRISGTDGMNMDPFRVNSRFSFRGRLGMDTGNAMPYFTLGYIASTFRADQNGEGANIANFTATGISCGIGVDLQVNRSHTRFVRVELQATEYPEGVFSFGGAEDHVMTAFSRRFTVGYGISF